MNQPVKLLFDECLGRPMLDVIRAAVLYARIPVVIDHLLSFSGSSTWDDVWIPRIAADNWIIVTGDSGSGGKAKGEKLPIVCQQHGVTHIMFSGKLQQKNGFEKIRAILNVWEQIVLLPGQPKGTSWSIQMNSAGGVKLVEKPIGPTPPLQPQT